MKSPRRQQQETEQHHASWQGQNTWQWDQQQGKSPRQKKNRARSAKSSKQPGQGIPPQMPMLPGPPMHNAAMAPMAPMMAWNVQPQMMQPYQPMHAQQPLPPPPMPPSAVMPNVPPAQMPSVMGPNFVMPTMPKMPPMPQPQASETIGTDLMTMLRQDVAELPLHIQKAVKESTLKEGVKDGAKATKDLQAAAKQLGSARKAYEASILARSQLHSNWKKFLSDAVSLWQDYATQFTAQERKLQDQVAAAKETFLLAKEASAKAHEAAGAVQEIHSDEEFGDVPNVPSAAAARITESMTGLSQSLQDLQQQAAAIDAEEKQHQAKRPRTAQGVPDAQMQNEEMDSGAGGQKSSFGQAGC